MSLSQLLVVVSAVTIDFDWKQFKVVYSTCEFSETTLEAVKAPFSKSLSREEAHEAATKAPASARQTVTGLTEFELFLGGQFHPGGPEDNEDIDPDEEPKSRPLDIR